MKSMINLPVQFGRDIHQAEGCTSVLKLACKSMEVSLMSIRWVTEVLKESICEVTSRIYR